MEKHFGTGIETRSRCSLENKLLMLWCNLFTTGLWYISNISAFVVKERKKTERTKKKSLFFAACKSHPPPLKKKKTSVFLVSTFFHMNILLDFSPFYNMQKAFPVIEAFSMLSTLDQINSAVTFNDPISFKDQFKLFGFLLEFLPFFHHPSLSLRIY